MVWTHASARRFKQERKRSTSRSPVQIKRTKNQNTNFKPSCSSRIGFLVVVIDPYSGLDSVVFGSFQIGWSTG